VGDEVELWRQGTHLLGGAGGIDARAQ
jgi:hypothetical protein